MSDREKARVWVTRDWLTKGAVETEGEVLPNGMLYITESRYPWVRKQFWHRTREKAEAHIDTLVAARIKSLIGQLKKLRAIQQDREMVASAKS